MNCTRRHRYTAWLALLAMLMIFVAPVVSQSLAMAHAPAEHEAAMHEAAMHEAKGHEAKGHEAGISAHSHGDPASAPAEHSGHDLAKCGYCPLLTQLPALEGCSGVVLGVALQRSEPAPHGGCKHHVTTDGFPDALPRAPPWTGGNHESLPRA